MGYQNLESLLSYCGRVSPDNNLGGGSSSSSDWQIFASSLNDRVFSCDLSTLMFQEQYFYELFLTDGSTYYPVPIRILNLRVEGSYPNQKYPHSSNLCDSSDVFVRRFFLFDRVSGISSSSIATSERGPSQAFISYLPDVIRYASYLRLSIQLDPDNTGRILAPILTIDYSETNPGSWQSPIVTYPTIGTPHYASPKVVDYTVAVDYSMDLSMFYQTVLGFFIAMMVLMGMLICLRYYNWSKRNARIITNARYSTDLGGFNTRILFELVLIIIHSYVLMIFPFIVLISWYIFVTFKLQKSASFLLPPLSSSYYTPFIINIYVMSFFQLAYVLIVLIYRHSNAEVYLIDWESKNTEKTRTSGYNTPKVSVWRTLFIANEYSKLSIRRRSNILFTLFFLCLILIGLNYQSDASQQPSLDKQNTTASTNLVLRFAASVWWWLLLSCGQILYKFVFYERYVSELPEQVFLDLCTIAKISIFILDESYHGKSHSWRNTLLPLIASTVIFCLFYRILSALSITSSLC
jgi:meckelin